MGQWLTAVLRGSTDVVSPLELGEDQDCITARRNRAKSGPRPHSRWQVSSLGGIQIRQHPTSRDWEGTSTMTCTFGCSNNVLPRWT